MKGDAKEIEKLLREPEGAQCLAWALRGALTMMSRDETATPSRAQLEMWAEEAEKAANRVIALRTTVLSLIWGYPQEPPPPEILEWAQREPTSTDD